MIFPEDAHPQLPPKPSVMGRRGVLGTLGLAGFGLLTTTAASYALPSKSDLKISVPTSSRNSRAAAIRFSQLSDLPAEWFSKNRSAGDSTGA